MSEATQVAEGVESKANEVSAGHASWLFGGTTLLQLGLAPRAQTRQPRMKLLVASVELFTADCRTRLHFRSTLRLGGDRPPDGACRVGPTLERQPPSGDKAPVESTRLRLRRTERSGP